MNAPHADGSIRLLHLQGALYRYPKTKTDVFSDLSIEVRRGEQVAIVGASGGGKSTLLYALAAMLRLQRGRYEFAGAAIHAMRDSEIDAWRSANIGFIYQSPALLPHLSLLDNALLPVAHERGKKQFWRDRAQHLLSALGLEGLANRLPPEVSGGQAQRAAIARALMRSPPLVLADEPTSALDDASAANVIEVLQTACGGDTTLILATHDARLLQAGTRVLAMSSLTAPAAEPAAQG